MAGELLEEAKRNVLTMCASWATGEQLRQIDQALTISFQELNVTREETALSTDVLPANDEYLKQFLAIKLVKGLSKRTLDYYRDTVHMFFRKCYKPISTVTTNDIRLYLAMREVQDHVSKTTQNNELRNLRSFFTTIADEGLISDNPTHRVERIKEPKRLKQPFSELELEQIRVAATKYGREREQARNIAIIEVLFSTGCRVSELCGMDRADIVDDRVTVIGKGNKERVCYLNPRALMALKNHLEKRNDNDPWLFGRCCTPSQRLKPSGVEIIVRGIGALAGVADCHPHRFRRTAATIALRRGMPIEQVSKLLGHSSLSTTQIYAITSEADVHASHQKYLS